MIRSKKFLWITFAFCVTTASCEEFLIKIGEDVKMECNGFDSKLDVDWKQNNVLLLSANKAGRMRKGSSDTVQRARIENNALKITSVKSSDAGEYRCQSSNPKTAAHKLYVMSAHANPSSVLYLGETKLNCDVGSFPGTVQWLTPDSKPYSKSGKEVHVEKVSSQMAGDWTCSVRKNEKSPAVEIKVQLKVVGPLSTTKEVNASEGSDAQLLCFLPTACTKTITGGSWSRVTPQAISLLTLVNKQNAVQWESTNATTKKMSFSNQGLNQYFNLTLEKVKIDDAGEYECKLEFGDGQFLSTRLNLMVEKKNADDSDYTTPNPMNKSTWGLPLWVWIAISVSLLVLIVLTVIIVLIHCRNKRIKRKVKKMALRKSMAPKNYCKCNRTVRQPHTGKKERPPPLPRHHYSALNE